MSGKGIKVKCREGFHGEKLQKSNCFEEVRVIKLGYRVLFNAGCLKSLHCALTGGWTSGKTYTRSTSLTGKLLDNAIVYTGAQCLLRYKCFLLSTNYLLFWRPLTISRKNKTRRHFKSRLLTLHSHSSNVQW